MRKLAPWAGSCNAWAGGSVALLGLADLYLTVLYARSGTSLLSERLAKWTWHGLRLLARPSPATAIASSPSAALRSCS